MNLVRRLLRSDYFLRLAIALGGVILGAFFTNLLNGDARFVWSLVALLVLTTLGLILSIQDSTQHTEGIAEQVARVCGDLSATKDELVRNFGVRVQVQLIDDIVEHDDVDHDIVSVIMHGAQDEILVADIGSPHIAPDIGIPDDLRRQHLDRLITKAAGSSAMVYQRIYQMKDGLTGADLFASDPLMRQHCTQMCDLASEGDRVYLGTLPRMYPYSWIIVDNSVLILELYRYMDGDEEPRYNGAIIIHDPNHQFTPYYRQMWQHLHGQATPLKTRDLAAHSAAAGSG